MSKTQTTAPNGPALLRSALSDCRPVAALATPNPLALPDGVCLPGAGDIQIGNAGLFSLHGAVQAAFAAHQDLARLCSDNGGLHAAMVALDEIASVDGGDDSANWSSFLARFRQRVLGAAARKDIHFYPVLLPFDEFLMPFDVGPVRVQHRLDWLGQTEKAHPEFKSWTEIVARWWETGIPHKIEECRSEAEREAMRNETAMEVFEGGRKTPWTAQVPVDGFEPGESMRRADIAVRCAIDVFRIGYAPPPFTRIGLEADLRASEKPIGYVMRPDGGLWRRAHEGMDDPASPMKTGAGKLVQSTKRLREAAGRRIAIYLRPGRGTDGCPRLSERWLFALHRLGRACLEPLHYAATEALAFALDGLALDEPPRKSPAAKKNRQELIIDIACALTGMQPDDPVMSDGRSLKSVIGDCYRSRNKSSHGAEQNSESRPDWGLHGFDFRVWEARQVARGICSVLLARYLLELDAYALIKGSADNAEDFLDHLELRLPLPASSPAGP